MTTTQARKSKKVTPPVEEEASSFIEDVREGASRHQRTWIGVGVGALVFVGLVAYARSARRNRRRNALWDAASLLLRQGRPERPEPVRDGFIKQALKQAGASLITMTANELGRRALQELSPPEPVPEEAAH